MRLSLLEQLIVSGRGFSINSDAFIREVSRMMRCSRVLDVDPLEDPTGTVSFFTDIFAGRGGHLSTPVLEGPDGWTIASSQTSTAGHVTVSVWSPELDLDLSVAHWPVCAAELFDAQVTYRYSAHDLGTIETAAIAWEQVARTVVRNANDVLNRTRQTAP